MLTTGHLIKDHFLLIERKKQEQSKRAVDLVSPPPAVLRPRALDHFYADIVAVADWLIPQQKLEWRREERNRGEGDLDQGSLRHQPGFLNWPRWQFLGKG